MPQLSESTLLIDCIATFALPEQRRGTDRIECGGWKRMVTSFETPVVEKVSDVLILVLNRCVRVASFPSFTDCTVEYPDVIDVASFVSRSAGKYRMVAVVFLEFENKAVLYAFGSGKWGFSWSFMRASVRGGSFGGTSCRCISKRRDLRERSGMK
jgi:ubiquitin C-terminal hydrolase